MRIGRKTAAFGEILAKVLKMALFEAAFEKRAGIDPRRGVALKIDIVTGKTLSATAEEMVESDFVQRGARSEGRDVTAEAAVAAVGVDDHGHGVPANVALNAAFHLLVTREGSLLLGRDSINIWRADDARGF